MENKVRNIDFNKQDGLFLFKIKSKIDPKSINIPMHWTVLFYVAYSFLLIEKFAYQQEIKLGIGIATAVTFPLAIYLTLKVFKKADNFYSFISYSIFYSFLGSFIDKLNSKIMLFLLNGDINNLHSFTQNLSTIGTVGLVLFYLLAAFLNLYFIILGISKGMKILEFSFGKFFLSMLVYAVLQLIILIPLHMIFGIVTL